MDDKWKMQSWKLETLNNVMQDIGIFQEYFRHTSS